MGQEVLLASHHLALSVVQRLPLVTSAELESQPARGVGVGMVSTPICLFL